MQGAVLMKYQPFFRTSVILLLLTSLFLTGCSQSDGPDPTITFHPGQLNVRKPTADGITTIGGSPLLLDISHTDQGYFIGTLTENSGKINLQVIGPDGITYKYFIEEINVPSVFPLTAGSGNYMVLAFQNITGDQYSPLFCHEISVELASEFLPFLYPNQYVNFTADSQAVKLAEELTKNVTSDLDALTVIFEYVTEHITYDNVKAASVSGNYLPDIDETLASGTGICFDYASLTAAMLRSVGIPTKLVIGYSASVKHAWIEVYIQSAGWINQAVEFTGEEWKLLDPTFASASEDGSIQEYIGNGGYYITEYVH